MKTYTIGTEPVEVAFLDFYKKSFSEGTMLLSLVLRECERHPENRAALMAAYKAQPRRVNGPHIPCGTDASWNEAMSFINGWHVRAR